tara:strand:- start:1138 stop:1422 length:285 start_codon:yes stop_codon:yes gene_type:complete
MTTYFRRKRDYYNIITPITLGGGVLGLSRGVYTTLAGLAGGAGAGVLTSALWQAKDGQPVLPEIQNTLGTSFFSKKEREMDDVVVVSEFMDDSE